MPSEDVQNASVQTNTKEQDFERVFASHGCSVCAEGSGAWQRWWKRFWSKHVCMHDDCKFTSPGSAPSFSPCQSFCSRAFSISHLHTNACTIKWLMGCMIHVPTCPSDNRHAWMLHQASSPMHTIVWDIVWQYSLVCDWLRQGIAERSSFSRYNCLHSDMPIHQTVQLVYCCSWDEAAELYLWTKNVLLPPFLLTWKSTVVFLLRPPFHNRLPALLHTYPTSCSPPSNAWRWRWNFLKKN